MSTSRVCLTTGPKPYYQDCRHIDLVGDKHKPIKSFLISTSPLLHNLTLTHIYRNDKINTEIYVNVQNAHLINTP